MDDDILWEAQKSMEYVINEVASRGWTDVPLDIDRFAELRQDRMFRDAQVAALYEEYFLPQRHESDWQLLSEIVQALVHVVLTSPVTDFAAGAIASGVIGSSAYDLLKRMCTHAASLLESKLGEKAHERVASFKRIGEDAEKLKTFFLQKEKARIEEIEQATSLRREQIYPLLKLAGFNHYRRGSPCYWARP